MAYPTNGTRRFTRHGFAVTVDNTGLTVTKAATFGGAQVALAFPLDKNDAREMALAILQLVG